MPAALIDPADWRRPAATDACVVELLQRRGIDPRACRDLGGWMSLNLHVEDEGTVVRVHPRFVDLPRLEALAALRTWLAGRGVAVAVPLATDRAGVHLVEVERYRPGTRLDASPAAYEWMFEVAGALHQHLRTAAPVPDPRIATYDDPPSLRAQLAHTCSVVEGDEAHADVRRLADLVDRLEAQRPPASTLPCHVVHGDVRLGNVVVAADGGPLWYDFGFAAVRPRVHELAYALAWILLRPDGSGRADEADWPWIHALVRRYEEGCGEALRVEERAAIGPYLAAIPLSIAVIAGRNPDPAGFLRLEREFVAIADWVLEHRPFAP